MLYLEEVALMFIFKVSTSGDTSILTILICLVSNAQLTTLPFHYANQPLKKMARKLPLGGGST
jgi:hypothetical protein